MYVVVSLEFGGSNGRSDPGTGRNPTRGQYFVIPLLVLRFLWPKFLAPRSDKDPKKKCDKARVAPHGQNNEARIVL